MSEEFERKNDKVCRDTYTVCLYLSKFNKDAVKELGCKTQKEALTKISTVLNAKFSTVKLLRDQFDPFFPNGRKGWKKPGRIAINTVDEFGNYDFKNLTKIVKNILEEKSLFGERFNNFKDAERESLKQVFETEKMLKQKERSPEEEKCVLALYKVEGGKREVPIFDEKSHLLVGIADLITHKEIIEVKNIKNWKHALGQIFTYWYYEANIDLIPRVHLFGGYGIADDRMKLCQSLMKKIFYPYTNLITKVTYAEDFPEFEEFD